MKIAKQKMNRMKHICNIPRTHGSTTHGKFLEMFLSDLYKFPEYEQYNGKVDFPKEIVSQGEVPREWVGDWEVKYYNIKSTHIKLGDVVRKSQCLKKGLILVIGFYDGDPKNLIDVVFIRAKASAKLIKYFDEWKKASEFVKDKNNTLEQTKQYVKQTNARIKNEFYLVNTSAKPRYSNSKGRWLDETRSLTLGISLKNLIKLYVQA
jgi:hypothetical protein